MNIEFTIPRVPLSPNRMLTMHWAERGRENKAWQAEMLAALDPGKRTVIRMCAQDGKMKVSIRIYVVRKLDPDNLVGAVKPILDGMRACRYLKDDTEEHVSLEIQQEKLPIGDGNARTVIQVGPEE